MYKKAFLFNGIGTRYDKLLEALPAELMDHYETLREDVFKRYGLNTEMEKNIGTDAQAAEWMVPFLCDRVVCDYYTEIGIIPDIGMGYSSGIVSASACFGAFDHDVSYSIVMTHSKIAENLRNHGKNLNMGIVIGFPYDDLKEMLSAKFSPDELIIGSSNSSFHDMICGEADAVAEAIEYCISEGALKAFPMNTGTAFHHPIMIDYAVPSIDICRNAEYRNPDHPLMSVFDMNVLETPEEIRRENILNVHTPMRWDLALKKLEELGVTEFYDLSTNGGIKKYSRVGRKCRIYTFEDVLSGNYPH